MDILADTRANVALIISTLSLAKSDDSEAFDSIFKIGHLSGRNFV